MNKPTDLARIPVDHDIDTNVSSNEHFSSVLEAHLSRRSLLRGGAATAASALLGAIGLSGCGGSDNGNPTDFTAFPSLTRNAFSGLALAVVRSKAGASGDITVSAQATGLKGAEVVLKAS